MAAAGRAGLVVYQNTGGVDAIDEYSRRLAAALAAHGTPAEYVAGGLSAARRRGGDPPWILLQYNPLSYGRWGVAPALLRDAAALRCRRSTTLAVCVHEPWTHVHDWRSAAMATYHGAQLLALLELAEVTFAVTAGLARRLGRRAVHLAVASNVTPVAVSRQAARERLGIGGELVVSLFGTTHPSRAIDHAEAALAALARHGGTPALRVFNLGDGAPPLAVLAGVRLHAPGRLESAQLSLRLRASDLVLLPFVEGISTRRTTLMAAFAHEVAVAGVHGRATDDVLKAHPEALLLTPAADAAAYARAVVELAADPARLRSMGSAGRRLYEREFDWPVLAATVTSALPHDATAS